MKGSLQLITGPMFCGKSTELLRRADRYRIQKREVLLAKYANDIRYSQDSIATHSGIAMKAVSVTSIKQLFNEFQSLLAVAEVVCIDEGQFIQELELCDQIASSGKVVIVAGLDSDYLRNPFPEIIKLIPLAESITKLQSVCFNC